MDNRIKEVIKAKGMTAKELAEKIGLSSVSLYNIINGKQEASANTLKIISECLNVPFWQLFVSPEEVSKESGTGLHCPVCGAELELKQKEVKTFQGIK